MTVRIEKPSLNLREELAKGTDNTLDKAVWGDLTVNGNISSTGIDVTGTIAADAANIAGTITADKVDIDSTAVEALRVDSSTTSVLVINSTATGKIAQIGGSRFLSITDDGTDVLLGAEGNGGAAAGLKFTTDPFTSNVTRINVSKDGDISFYEDTGTTAKFFWDASAESLSLGGSSGATWTQGTGTPEGSVTAPVGSFYSRTDGGAGTSFYVKESGTGNTGWVAK